MPQVISWHVHVHLPTQAGLRTLEAENYVSGLVHRQVWWMSSEFHPAYIKIQ